MASIIPAIDEGEKVQLPIRQDFLVLLAPSLRAKRSNPFCQRDCFGVLPLAMTIEGPVHQDHLNPP